MGRALGAVAAVVLAAWAMLAFRSGSAGPEETGTSVPSIAVPSALLDGREPSANWIWVEGPDNPRNFYLLVRKTIDLEEAPVAARAFISASAFADVYINGKLVDRCPMNSDPEYQVYERYDLAGWFRKGKNTISALVYNYGLGMHHRIDARGGFFFQAVLSLGKGMERSVDTDGSWLVSQAVAWDDGSELRTGPSPEAPNLIGFVERFDARLMPDGWRENGFDDSGWRPARVLGKPPLPPWNSIVAVSRPRIFREEVRPVNRRLVGGAVVYDFGREISGTPVIELEAGRAGLVMEMGTGERLLADGSVLYKDRVDYSDYYTSKSGPQSWGPVTWRGFRYLSLSAGAGLTIKNVSAVGRHYDLERQGSFECSDPLLNRIWETGNRTLLLCAQDTYIDTPWREQTQYIAGDSRYLQKYAFYTFGMSSELPTRYNLLSGAWSQRWKDDGSIRSRYPTGWLLGPNTSVYLADYQLEWAIMLGEYYRYFGDAGLVRQVYPNLKKLMGLFAGHVGREHGLLADVPGWIVLDHPDTFPMDQGREITGLNCLYYAALRQAAIMARDAVGDREQAEIWTKKADALRDDIRKWLRADSGPLFVDSYGSGKRSQQTEVYALLYGLVDEAERRDVIEAIASAGRSSEQAFAYYVLYSVFDERPQWALDYIRKYWGEQMRSRLFNGAWHEAWDIEHFKTDLLSTSHAWCSGPTALLPQKVLGVEPASAGWRTFTVRPEPCDLEWARGIVPSPLGPIDIEWEHGKSGDFRLWVRVPQGSSAELFVPGTDPTRLTINSKPIDKCPGITAAPDSAEGRKSGRIVLRAASGNYRIISAGLSRVPGISSSQLH